MGEQWRRRCFSIITPLPARIICLVYVPFLDRVPPPSFTDVLLTRWIRGPKFLRVENWDFGEEHTHYWDSRFNHCCKLYFIARMEVALSDTWDLVEYNVGYVNRLSWNVIYLIVRAVGQGLCTAIDTSDSGSGSVR